MMAVHRLQQLPVLPQVQHRRSTTLAATGTNCGTTSDGASVRPITACFLPQSNVPGVTAARFLTLIALALAVTCSAVSLSKLLPEATVHT